MRTIADAARKAGMEVTELIVPGTATTGTRCRAVWPPVSTGSATDRLGAR